MVKTVILGIGNVLLGDEGFGVHFVRWLSGQYLFPGSVRIVDGGVLGYGLLDTVCDCGHLLVIDAIRPGDEPGAIYRLTREELEARNPPAASAHEVAFMDVLCKAELMGEAPGVVFLCIVPGCCADMDLEMSPGMREKFPVVAELLLHELRNLGIEPLAGPGG